VFFASLDVKFLERMNTTGYSLVLGLHNTTDATEHISVTQKTNNRWLDGMEGRNNRDGGG